MGVFHYFLGHYSWSLDVDHWIRNNWVGGVIIVGFALLAISVLFGPGVLNEAIADENPTCYGHMVRIGHVVADGMNFIVLQDEHGKQYFKCGNGSDCVLIPVCYKLPIVAEKE